MGLVLGSCLLTGCAKFFPAEKEETSAQTTSDTREIFAMDTVMTVTAYGDLAEEAVQAAAEEIQNGLSQRKPDIETMKERVRREVAKCLTSRTGRNPMVIPVIIDL